jgi:glycosyltransferase involved in cell wall biosynthesis
MGIVDTLNYAYSIAKGEYIARMDGDDISELDRLEKQFNFLSQNRQYALVGVSLIGIDHFGNEISKFKHISSWSLISRTLMFVTPVSHVWLAHKYLYDRLKGYRNIPGAEDYDFLLRAKSCGYQFSNVPNYFGYRVRINREGNTHSLLGLSQRLMFQYSYDLYKERMSNGTDSYSKRVLQKILGYSKYRASIYSYSANCLSRAIIYRADGRYFLMLVYIIYSLISLDMIKYYYQRFMLKVALEFNLREEM